MIRITQAQVAPVNISNLQEVLYKREYAAALAVQIAASTAEGILDMIMDYPGEYPTFKDVSRMFDADHIQGSVQDYLNDVLSDLKAEIVEQLKNVKVKVVSTTYTEKEITADIHVSNI